MKNIKIKTNFYPFVLWDIAPISGKHSEDIKEASGGLGSTNLYMKDAQVDNLDDIKNIKTSLLESRVTKINLLNKVFFLNYLIPLFLIWVLWHMNQHYPSMVGLMLGSVAYLIFWQLKRRIALWAAILFAFALISSLIGYIFYDFRTAMEFNVYSIISYALRYAFIFFIFESILTSLLINKDKLFYKIESISGAYFSIVDEKSIEMENSAKAKARKLFTLLLIISSLISFVFGGIDLLYKIDMKIEVQKKAYIKEQNQKQIQDVKDFEVFKSSLDREAKEVGINWHSNKASIALMKRDLDSYKKNGIIGYDKIRITRTNKILRLKDKKIISLERLKSPSIIKPAYVKMYENKYRWHFIFNDETHIVLNATAR